MRVKFLTRSCGPDGVIHPGQIVDVPESEAALLVAGNYAMYTDAGIEFPPPMTHIGTDESQKDENAPQMEAPRKKAKRKG